MGEGIKYAADTRNFGRCFIADSNKRQYQAQGKSAYILQRFSGFFYCWLPVYAGTVSDIRPGGGTSFHTIGPGSVLDLDGRHLRCMFPDWKYYSAGQNRKRSNGYFPGSRPNSDGTDDRSLWPVLCCASSFNISSCNRRSAGNQRRGYCLPCPGKAKPPQKAQPHRQDIHGCGACSVF